MKTLQKTEKFILLFIIIGLLAGCGGDTKPSKVTSKKAPKSMLAKKNTSKTSAKDDKGIGPIKEITLSAIDAKLVEKGEAIYKEKCTACHKPYEKFIGPAPVGLLQRRSPEWIMNMILNPEEMVKNDPTAQNLFIDNKSVQMTNQNLTKDDARAVLEYIRTLKLSDKK